MALRGELQRLDDKFVIPAVQNELADFAELAFDDGVVLARNHLAGEHRAWRERSRAGIDLDADVGRDHGPQDGDVALAIDAQEHEEQRFGLATGSR